MSKEDEWKTINATVSIKGHPLEMQMTVPKKSVTARKMLPIFRQMANSFVQIGVNAVESNGEKISCKAGCGACCRQPVPISESEVYQLAELVEEMPEPRRSKIKEKFQKGVEHFAGIGWFEKLERTVSAPAEVRQAVLDEYFHEGIPCPFLEKESCSIYEERPLVCREYLVTTPAENCKNPTPQSIRTIAVPIKPSPAVCSMTKSENMNAGINFVPLILSLDWAKNFPEQAEEKPGEEWLKDFFKNITGKDVPDS